MMNLSRENFQLDTSIIEACREIVINGWEFQDIFSIKRDQVMLVNADEIFDYFMNNSNLVNMRYRIFYGNTCVIWNDEVMIRFSGEFMSRRTINKRYDEDILIEGRKSKVEEIVNSFDTFFKDKFVSDHHSVELVMQGQHGLEYASLPVKNNQHFYPELYPSLGDDPIGFIEGFLASKANVLILMGEAGMGKSALINEIILTAKRRTQVVYDKEIMGNDVLYTAFIKQALREDGGVMVMEDADNVLSDRIISNNNTMAKLLNLSDGIIDTSGAKFIFTANIKELSDIDHALTRPGRCYDIVRFTPLTYKQACIAANAIGIELHDKAEDTYTVAEIFNHTSNRHEKKIKFGFN